MISACPGHHRPCIPPSVMCDVLRSNMILRAEFHGAVIRYIPIESLS